MQPNIAAVRVADASARKERASLDLASLSASSNDRSQILIAIGEGCSESQAYWHTARSLRSHTHTEPKPGSENAQCWECNGKTAPQLMAV